MIISSGHELFVFFGSVIGGIVLGMIFDIFNVIRPSDKTNSAVLGILDLLLWGIITVAVFGIIFIINDAAVRWYEFAGMILGVVVYFMLFSRVFVALFKGLLRILKKVIVWFLTIILFPFRLIFRLLKPVFAFVKKKLQLVKLIYKKVKTKVKNISKRIKHSVKKI